MDEESEYRMYAIECASWAEATADADLREKLLKMAADWMKAAERAMDGRPRPRSRNAKDPCPVGRGASDGLLEERGIAKLTITSVLSSTGRCPN